jgi:oligoribonuclease
MKPINKMVWVDLETTGLDPNNDSILEIAVLVTQGTNFDEVYGTSYVLPLPVRTINSFHPAVLEMHGRTGLFVECANSSTQLARVELQIIAGLRSAMDYVDSFGPICGSSPHFDRRFLEVHMPGLAKFFSYRTFDVSTLRQAYVNLIQMGGEAPAVDPDNTQHRAMADIRRSVQRAREITKYLRDGMYK